MTPTRCAAYLRYSIDRQNPLSIQDQLRRCREFTESQAWALLPAHCYVDEAVSGTGADRPGLIRLLEAAAENPRPFDVVVVDDTSRLSRNQGDVARIFEKLNFLGVRLIAVSQGIDSQHEQADVLITMHGLVDSLYVKELAKKTHRGMEGRVLKGLHAGGRCYGYRNVRLPEGGVKLEVEEAEATVVRRIFEQSASGHSLKSIARAFNAEKLPPPRRRAGRPRITWCPTAIYAMLRRELYIGRIVWNRSYFVKRPGTNKRVSRPRPRGEWRFVERPELRIVSDELWNAVRQRLRSLKDMGVGRSRSGLVHRSGTSSYLFSGLLKCATCGGNLVIATGHAPGRYPKYGCSQHHYRGACTNGVLVRRDFLEEMFLSGLQQQVLEPQAIEYTLGEFVRQLRVSLSHIHDAARERSRQKERLGLELSRLVATAAEAGPSEFLVRAIRDREQELRGLGDNSPQGPRLIERALLQAREFVVRQVSDLRGLLLKDSVSARAELRAHVEEIRMHPSYPAEGKPFYVAEGKWNLLGDLARMLPPRDGSIRMVAGVRFELTTFGL